MQHPTREQRQEPEGWEDPGDQPEGKDCPGHRAQTVGFFSGPCQSKGGIQPDTGAQKRPCLGFASKSQRLQANAIPAQCAQHPSNRLASRVPRDTFFWYLLSWAEFRGHAQADQARWSS